MITNPKMRPNECIYINLGSLEPYINLDIPKKQLAREIKKISSENYSSNIPEVVFNQESGKYQIVGNYTTFYAYASLYKSNILIPCKAFYTLEEDERYLLSIDWIMKNHVINWYDRHKIITRLIIDFKYSKTDLAIFLNKGTNDIRFYLEPPIHVKNETIHQGKERIINKISLEAFKKEHNKDYLYILTLINNFPITYDQLTYISWLRSKSIKFEECNLTIEQEHQLIDKALHLKVDFLNSIKEIINEMQLENGNKPIF